MFKSENDQPLTGFIADLAIPHRAGARLMSFLASVTGGFMVWDGSAWAESITVILRALGLNVAATSSATGAVIYHLGPSSTEGLQRKMLVETLAPDAVETAMATAIPKGAIVRAVLANVQTALTGGGTTVTWSLGITGTVDKYGTAGYPTQADALTKNSKSSWLGDGSRLAADEKIKLCAAVTGGAAAGDTKLSAGTAKIVAIYDVPAALANA